MVSRSNLSSRPKTGGILSQVINPIGRNTSALKKPGQGLLQRSALGEMGAGPAGTKLVSEAENIVNPEVPSQASVSVPEVKVSPEQAPNRPGFTQTALQQSEAARASRPLDQGRGGIAGNMRTGIERAQENSAARQALAEAGGTRSENAVTAPSLNRSRRPRLNRR